MTKLINVKSLELTMKNDTVKDIYFKTILYK